MTARGPGTTIGVEEEFLFVDTGSRRPVPTAAAVLARLDGDAGGIKPELYESQVEAVTPVLTSLADAARSLVTSRAALARAAAAEGVAAVGVGTPVLAGPRPVLSTGDDRYRLVAGTYQGAFADYEACGCHVHVGVPGGDLAVAVVDHLRPWLPTLLALSANSPFHHGRDTGYASWRTIDQARFPGGGVPPRFGDFAGYERCLDQLVDCGVLVDERMTFWAARPSPRYATVEVRVADVAAAPDGALLQAALVRGLVRAALDDLSHGREAPEVDGQLAAGALWSAARYGIHGHGIDTIGRTSPVPARTLLAALLRRVRPALEDTGDVLAVDALLPPVLAGGAARQRATAAAGGLTAVVDELAGLLTEPVTGPAAGERSAEHAPVTR
ncbi:glutamate--cysteine ligase [Amycolatopsis sp. NBC_01307]|uniref:carboxylate-amine ligase n=1 Tax=Amycolatopsis sp. NBC_01307 TaxID=2903561 RepID=UPI002E11FED7|nr:glutamate--cysteine ligase [Amycolatopsis sp. NBC_01307]